MWKISLTVSFDEASGLNSKSMSADGKHQVTTDNAITTTEILKHRNTGRFLENTQYFQRKVTIPLNADASISHFLP